MGASPLLPQHSGVGDGGGSRQPGAPGAAPRGPLGWEGWGSAAGKFLGAETALPLFLGSFTPTCGLFFWGVGVFFLNEILQAGFAHQKGAV